MPPTPNRRPKLPGDSSLAMINCATEFPIVSMIAMNGAQLACWEDFMETSVIIKFITQSGLFAMAGVSAETGVMNLVVTTYPVTDLAFPQTDVLAIKRIASCSGVLELVTLTTLNCFTDKCNGFPTCEDHSDEWNCSCPQNMPIACDCNQQDIYTCSGRRMTCCYSQEDACDGLAQCVDASDETNCMCPDEHFTCPCFRQNFPTYNNTQGCIPLKYVNDGKPDCNDSGSDENYIKNYDNVQCGLCNVNIISLETSAYSQYPWCDKSTCLVVPVLGCLHESCKISDCICTSFCFGNSTDLDCSKIMQFSDQTEILNQNFCDRNINCKDESDEIVAGYGFKCSSKFSLIPCVLPLWNLYDGFANCYDKSDLCFCETDSFHCFRCVE
ncbi:unnamed protein product [Clavelina lepadiformis]|uniref:Uncharacterized protein n=1 Tax=Clavelina lepadiformis TaxID=159417 RepID=A0ABP0G9N1_CLALP